MEGGHDKQHYMFFANLTSIKHYIEEILKMDPEEVDNHLKNGHDWAADHIATSKDDIQEVADWIRNEIEGGHGSSEEPGEEMIEPENIEVEVEDEETPEEEEKEESEDDDDENED
jgi:alanyl-tRNA synthetase